MIEIRKTIILRETVFSELGVEANRPITRAVGMAVIRNPFAGQFIEELRPLFEAEAMLGERLMPELVRLLNGPAVSIGGGEAVIGSNVKVAAAGAVLDVPLGHKDDSWSFPHFDTITVSVAAAPRPDEILVVMAIADGGRLRNRCGAEPIR
jgi:Amino acid synthesis